jgi:hypothetical protein
MTTRVALVSEHASPWRSSGASTSVKRVLTPPGW